MTSVILFYVLLYVTALNFRLTEGFQFRSYRWPPKSLPKDARDLTRTIFGNRPCLQCNPKYDPFEGDQKLNSAVAAEIKLIREIPSSELRSELKLLGIPSKGTMERNELEKILARARVLSKLKKAENNIQLSRRQKVIQLKENLDKLKGLPWDSIIAELACRQIDVNPLSSREEMEVLLAKNIIETGIPIKKKKETLEAAVNETISILNSTRSGAFNTNNSLIKDNLNVVSNKVSSAINIIADKSLTDAEAIAQEFLANVTTDSDFDDTLDIDRRDLEAIVDGAFNFSSFDETKEWLIQFDRDLLVEALEFRGEVVPLYAPRSVVASMLADSIMIEKRQGFVHNYSAAALKPHMEYQSNFSFPSNSNKKQKINGVVKSNRDKLRDFESFSFEKEILYMVLHKLQTVISSISNLLRKFLKSVLSKEQLQKFPGLLNSPLVVIVVNVLYLVFNAVVTAALRFTNWSLRDMPPPLNAENSSTVLLIVCFIALFQKKGPGSVFISLLVIKFISKILPQTDGKRRNYKNTRIKGQKN